MQSKIVEHHSFISIVKTLKNAKKKEKRKEGNIGCCYCYCYIRGKKKSLGS